MDELIRDRINANLKRLQLNRIQEILDPILDRAQKESTSYLDVFDKLLTEEVCNKENRRYQAIIKQSGMPFQRTIDEYDFGFQPELDKRAVMNLFDLEFMRKKENVFFLGPPGVGKTHLAVALALKAAQMSQSIHCTTMFDLMKRLKSDNAINKKGRCRGYYRSSLVIVDEVGYMPISRRDAHLFFQFVCFRYEKRSTIITSNKSFSQWEELFGDPVIATAILDRLLHHSCVINIKGDSYRMNERHQGKEKPRTKSELKQLNHRALKA